MKALKSRPLFFHQYVLTFLGLYISSHSALAIEMEAGQEKSKDLIIIGASYARDWPLKSLECVTVINKGINADQVVNTRKRFTADVVNQHPEAVIIWGFINDLHANPKENIEQTVQNIKSSIEGMVDEAMANGIVPVLATEVTIAESQSLKWKVMAWIGKLRGKQSYQSYINGNVMKINEWIRELAGKKGLLLIDLEKILTNEQGNRIEGYAQDDGSHITRFAYDAITRYAKPLLIKDLVAKNNICL